MTTDGQLEFCDVWPDAGRAYRESFARKADAIPPRDPKVTAAEAPRLSGQNAAILARLRRGVATNKELAGIALKYTSRLSDLRKAGYAVSVVSHDHETGVVVYRLEEREVA
jgi:hypothetical protein